ncbi:MAG: choice-of-anchor L domain-containing protein [Pirellulales bacterium]|nr:choice-of-anchor L domain-containing protein [Pirellulales bacterium]
MRHANIGFAILAALLVVVPSLADDFTVTTSLGDASTLANTILGSGVTISGTPVYTGASGAAGTFVGGNATGIGIDKGIILTSGLASSAVGPNTDDGISTSNGTAGDSELNALVGGATNDAAILEFDFVTAGGDIYFNYVFASDEYDEWANSTYNDVFAFFLDGTNIALIPGTSEAVSINNVNAVDHPELYNDNDLTIYGAGGCPYNIEYDGFTNVLTAQALDIGAGTHHIKIAIADVGDSALDSAVFIEANTFSDQPVPEPASLIVWSLLGVLGMAAGWWRARR